jgi:hypothetical protein
VLVESGLLETLESIQEETGTDWLMYANVAYKNTSVIMAGFDQVHRRQDEDMEWLSKTYCLLVVQQVAGDPLHTSFSKGW